MASLGPWVPDRPDCPVGIAVSGGGDSLCLAWLATFWRKNLLALIVDHGLRPESAVEATLTQQRLHALGIPSQRVTLSHLKKGPGIAERARTARYAALVQMCREHGCVDLLLGHQADDQAETVAMRQRAKSGARGLAGMAWVTALPDVRLVRPLLGFSRAALRNTLHQNSVEWVDDPSNEDRSSERVRVRQAFRLDPEAQLDAWLNGARAGIARMQQEQDHAQHLLDRGQTLTEFGWACLGSDLSTASEQVRDLLRAVGGQNYLPSSDRVDALCRSQTERTLGGVQVTRHQQHWFLLREAAAQEGFVAVADGVVWDRRFVVSVPRMVQVEGLSLGAAGLGVPRAARRGWPARFCATLPALWRNGQRVAVPHLGLWEMQGLEQITITFRPPTPVRGGSLYGAELGVFDKNT
ncbi:tRNA(Ile)-lysidine synthase [Acetobacter cibinongensis]|uniref:tRNA(Ile)-lysidine synthase n=1 Tax=Acetobacter cibinongensis TaxID=146475 RepID=A0A0D6N5U5_9PROT|nr:tRNA lysidine(34) synthetase TilS [Acetobacter cibinongensis]GAN60866.1 Ile-tRNA lysidine synthase TilS [Acetobacter cibinongensis]GBQ13399.1 Ile-tRNA lysidine synthase [Acetobacter cibinongensis NRIC 0482]GEL58636.1 tRNA(Ile)-lysidine synthase [Acetobacter cibinongensis]